MKQSVLFLFCVLFVFLTCPAGPVETGDVNGPVKELISGFHVISGKEYKWSLLEPGSMIYTGGRRQHTYTTVPPQLAGQLVLRTANMDKYYEAAESPFISFKAKKSITVYVLYSDFYTQMEEVWLNERQGWHKEDFVVRTSISKNKTLRRVYSKSFQAGSKVILDGNGCVIKNCSMYTVVIVPAEKNN